MKSLSQEFYYATLPTQKDIKKIMANNGYISPDNENYQAIDQNSVYNSVGAPSTDTNPYMGFHGSVDEDPVNTVNNPNRFGDYFNTALGVADSLIPGERIHNNYPTQPLPVYNPYQYGTGSQAIGENGIMLESYDKDMADSGIHIKKANRGKFTAYKKRTGKTTEEALHSKDPRVRKMANFAKNAKKWHHAEDGIMLESFDKAMADQGIMLESYDKNMAAFGAQTGPGPVPPAGFQPVGKQIGTPQSRTDAYLLDDINSVLTTGNRTKNTGYAPEQQQLLTDAYVWKQKNPKINSQDAIRGYFNQSVDLSNPLQKQRARLSKIGYDPMAMYNQTPNLDVRIPPAQPPMPAQNPAVASTMEDGGFVEGSIHDLPEEQIAKMLKAGYRFEHFKD